MKSFSFSAIVALLALTANAAKRQMDGSTDALVIDGPIDDAIINQNPPFNPQDIMKQVQPSDDQALPDFGNKRGFKPSVGRASVTFFDDYTSVTGVDMYKYGKLNVQFQGRRVFPAAVHHNQASQFLYKIVEVSGPNMQPTLVQILDICDRDDYDCRNIKVYGYNMLIDMHKTGWNAIGQNDGVLRGQYRIIGSVGPKQIPRLLWSSSVRSGVFALCKCTGWCTDKEQVWAPVDQC